MLVNMSELLKDAQKNKYAVGLFNTITLESFNGVLKAAEEMNSPVIIGTAEVLLSYISLEDFAKLFSTKAKEAKVPVVIHLDHGYSLSVIKQAIKLGFTSVMYDCSAFAYDDNVHALQELTAFAHKNNVTVEGELGHVGTGEILENMYTDPDLACDYIEKTKVDALAVAVGTTHGPYKNSPKLDFKRIQMIHSLTDTPLVLHGGSGLSITDFQEAIAFGITKINIYTDINCAVAEAMYQHYKYGCGIDSLIPHIEQNVKEVAKTKIRIFGSENRA